MNARIRVNMHLYHDVRNHDADVSEVEDCVERDVNLFGDRIEGLDMSVGYRASGAKVTLCDKPFGARRLDSVVNRVVRSLERWNYADDIKESESRRHYRAVEVDEA